MLAIEGVDQLDVDLRAFERRIVEAAYVVEEIAAESAVRVDRSALEAEVGVIFGDLFIDGSVVDSDRDGERKGFVHALLQVEEATVDLVEVGGGDLVVGGGDELDTHIVERERGIAVVGDDHSHRDKSMLDIGQTEEAALVRVVTGIDADGDVLVGVGVEGGVLVCRFYRGSFVACCQRGDCEDADGGDDPESL